MAERLAIVGGDAAGMSAASAARRREPTLDVLAFERVPGADDPLLVAARAATKAL